MLKKIFPSLATIVALPLAVSLVGGLTPAVYANGVPQVTNDLFRRSSEEFFREGERRFEREIQFLTNGILVSRDDLLKVDRQLQIQKDLLQLEKPSVLPKDSRPSKLKMPQ